MLVEPYPPSIRTVHSPAGEPIITLSFEPASALLVARWHGHRTPDLVQIGAKELLLTLQQVPAQALFCDSSSVIGDWLDLMPWVEFEFLPAITASGIRALAFLPSTDAAHQLCVQMLAQLASTILPARIHTSEAAARTWLAAHEGF